VIKNVLKLCPQQSLFQVKSALSKALGNLVIILHEYEQPF